MQIKNMARVDIPAAPFVVANFDLELDDGIVIYDCAINDGWHGFDVQLPRRGRRELVTLPADLRAEFADTALLVFRHLPDDADDAGLRRVLRADVERMVGWVRPLPAAPAKRRSR